jgi:hypothetical protein
MGLRGPRSMCPAERAPHLHPLPDVTGEPGCYPSGEDSTLVPNISTSDRTSGAFLYVLHGL